VLRSGQYILGAETREFERLFADWVGARHAIAVANGLDALRLVLRSWISLGVLNPSSEFIVPANSFIASALAITDAGLKCSFADVSEATFNLTARTVRASLRPETAGVMVVHLYGQLARL
jgi:dTDP-4-amino-4,6-dideoxygalactose transaminase